MRFLYNPMAVENMIALHIEINVISTLKPEKVVLSLKIIIFENKFLKHANITYPMIVIYKNCENKSKIDYFYYFQLVS